MTKCLLLTNGFQNNSLAMKKMIIACVFLLMLTDNTFACDICGCGVGGNYIGIMPDFYKHIIGVRCRYNSLLTHIGAGGASTYLTTTEKYTTTEIWGGWNIGRKFRIMATIPYSFNSKTANNKTSSKNGLGDITFLGYYNLLNKRSMVFGSKLLTHSLWLGGGVKIPTGKYNPTDKQSGTQNANLFQLGTGSVDYLLNLMYDIRLQDAGLNISGGYKFNSTNKYHYSYGNKFSGSIQAYYKVKVKKDINFAPSIGIAYESSKQDIENKFLVDLSGGAIFSGLVGLEIKYKKISVGGNWQIPVNQNLANGFVKANNRMMAHISFIL